MNRKITAGFGLILLMLALPVLLVSGNVASAVVVLALAVILVMAGARTPPGSGEQQTVP